MGHTLNISTYLRKIIFKKIMIFLRLVVDCERKNSVKNGCSYFGLNNWMVGLSATDMKSTGRSFLGEKNQF